MTSLLELDRYVRSQKTAVKRPTAVAKSRGGFTRMSSAKAVSAARPHALARRAVAFSKPVDYSVPGIVSPLRQPSGMACWATAYTMMVSWRDQRSTPIEGTLAKVGQKWVDLFKADTGSSAEQEAELWAATGLLAQPLASHTIEGWEGLLRSYGPLAIIIDVDPGEKRAMHVVLMTGLHGDGTAAGTNATIADPARGDSRDVKFESFLSQYEQGAARRTASGRHNQIIHWPKDVKFAGAQSAHSAHSARAFTGKPKGPPRAPVTPAAPEPWSHYFQFRKGSAFEVDGPLSYNGTGEVLERTGDFLKFTMKMPAVSILGQDIPAADIIVEATYRKEGKGNLVRATMNGVVMEDNDAEIFSVGAKRTVTPKFTGVSGPTPEWITVEPDGDAIDLDMKIDGREVDFDLNRTSGSSGMALGVEPWSRSFPFAAHSGFTVDGPLSFDGRGRVHERSDTFLKFEMNMPPASVMGKDIPKLDLVLEATYAKEGSGNPLALTVNGSRHTDSNATILSDKDRRTIVPSIAIPGTKLGRISFAPDGRDEIDLDVEIDGTEHDFDLVKVKGPAAQAWARGMASSSSMVDALRVVAAFAARTGSTSWKLARADVAKRLDQLVRDPDLVDQGALNLCGPAAFFHLLARRDPVAFATYASEIFEKRTAKIGTLTVKPGDDLVFNDYAKIVPRMNPVTPIAEWMCLSALRDSENATTDFEGDPSEDFAGMTTPGELADWMKASGIYTSVYDEGNWVSTKGLSHALALFPGGTRVRDIVMLINANIISSAAPKRKKMLDSFPNHFIQLLSTVTNSGGNVEFDYWTWGMPGKQHAVVKTSDFTDNYYGTVTGDVV